MAIFAIGDMHLSLGTDKPMDVFPGWEGYLPRLEASWRKLIGPDDTVVLAGDTSWAMNLNDTKADFAFIQNLPGQKWLLKGNHDYWWTTTRKMENFLTANGFDTLHILHNNACTVGNVALCGTRGWPFDDVAAQGEKLMAREAGRLRMSLQAAGDAAEKIAFLHYPPIYPGAQAQELIQPAVQLGGDGRGRRFLEVLHAVEQLTRRRHDILQRTAENGRGLERRPGRRRRLMRSVGQKQQAPLHHADGKITQRPAERQAQAQRAPARPQAERRSLQHGLQRRARIEHGGRRGVAPLDGLAVRQKNGLGEGPQDP